jgi:hypothetical protein
MRKVGIVVGVSLVLFGTIVGSSGVQSQTVFSTRIKKDSLNIK